ncbi:MAG: amidohydrolase [Chloroflexi bacterium]|nr:amidohydrolase [Chloroflexota bacterium]
MIVDVHRHMWSAAQRHPIVREIAHSAPQVRYHQPDDVPLVPDVDSTADAIVAEMDEAGVDVSVLLMADYHRRLGDAIFSPEGENRVQVQMVHRHPDRLISFFGMDPRRPDAAELFEKALVEWGVRGLKLHPTVGFFPHDRACYPLYEKCVQHGVPVIFHTGPMPSPLYGRYARPTEFDDVAADFPEMTLIMAHSGQGHIALSHLWIEALAVAREKPNVILELSLWQIVYKEDPRAFVRSLDQMRREIGVERIVFGSDFPGPRDVLPLDAWVGAIKSLPSLGEEHGVRFDDADVDAILGGNAARILGLGDRA